MQTATQTTGPTADSSTLAAPLRGTPSATRAGLWAGWILGLLPVMFLLMDGVMKLVKPTVVIKTTVELGYPESVIFGLGIALVASTLLYVIPATAVLGAILLTGYLGGAVATHVRVAGGLFPVLFPVLIAALLWTGLCLRDRRLRALLPVRS